MGYSETLEGNMLRFGMAIDRAAKTLKYGFSLNIKIVECGYGLSLVYPSGREEQLRLIGPMDEQIDAALKLMNNYLSRVQPNTLNM